MKNLPEFVKLSYAFAPVLEIILHSAGPVVPFTHRQHVRERKVGKRKLHGTKLRSAVLASR